MKQEIDVTERRGLQRKKNFYISVRMEEEARVMNSSDKLRKLHFIQHLEPGP